MNQIVQVQRTDPKWTRKILTALGIYLAFQFVFPPAAPITKAGMGVLGVFAATLYLWITESIGWPSLLMIGMFGLTGVDSASNLFSKTWGNVMVPFLVACFLLNYAMAETGLTRRFALWFITRKSCRGKPWRILFMFFLSIMFLGMVSTSSAIVVMYMAIAEQMFLDTGCQKGEKLPKAVMVFIFWIAQGAMCTTPISHVLIPMIFGYLFSDFGLTVTTTQFSMVFLTFGAFYFVSLWLVFRYLIKPDVSNLANLDLDKLEASVLPMQGRERVVALVFGILVFFWLSPDFLQFIPGLAGAASFINSLGQGIPALVAVGTLAAVKIHDVPVLNVPAACTKVPWSGVFMMAAVMGTGYVFGLDSCGIFAWLTENLGPAMTNLPSGLFVFAAIAWVLVMTNLMSNTLSASMYTVIIPLAMLVPGVNPIALGLCIASACNAGLATPGACPAAAMPSANGWTPVSFQVKWGLLIAAVCQIGFYFIGYPLCKVLFPY